MIVENLNENVEIIQTLGTYPNQDQGLSAEDLKAKFDEAAKIIKAYLNEIIVPILRKTAPLDDKAANNSAVWSAEKILHMIAQGGTGHIDLCGREFTAGKVIICSDPTREGFYMKSSLEGDYNGSPVAEMSGTNDDGIPVIIRNIAEGVQDLDAVNVKQLEQALLGNVLIVSVSRDENFKLFATPAAGEIYKALISQRKVFLQTKDGWFPCVFASEDRAMFAQVDYEDGSILAYHVLEDGTVETIEKAIAFNDGIPRIDDDVVAANKIWSSKNTVASIEKAVKALCIPVDVTDNTVQICPVAGVPVKVTVAEDLEYAHVKLYCVGKNLFDATVHGNMEDGYILQNSGNVANTNTSLRSKPIPVSHLVGKTLAIAGAYVGGNYPGWAFYDADNVYISGDNTATATVPEGAAFFRFSNRTSL